MLGPDFSRLTHYWNFSIPFFFLALVAITWFLAWSMGISGGLWWRCPAAVAAFWGTFPLIDWVERQPWVPVGMDLLPWTTFVVVTAGVVVTRSFLGTTWFKGTAIWLGQLALGFPACLLIYWCVLSALSRLAYS